MSVRDSVVGLLGEHDDRARPLRLLLGLAALLSAPTIGFALLMVVDDLRDRTEQMDGLGLAFGVVLLLWAGLVVLLCGLALRLRERRAAGAVLGVLGGLGTFWVSTVALSWWPGVPDLVSVPLTLLGVALGIAAVALGVVAARR